MDFIFLAHILQEMTYQHIFELITQCQNQMHRDGFYLVAHNPV